MRSLLSLRARNDAARALGAPGNSSLAREAAKGTTTEENSLRRGRPLCVDVERRYGVLPH